VIDKPWGFFGVGFVFAILLSVIAGCAQLGRVPTPSIDGPPVEPWSHDKLVQALGQRLEQFQSLRSLATISYSGPEGRRAFDEAILVKRPNRLRLETLSALGAILVVSAGPQELVGFHPREGLFFRGKPSRENLLRYTQIPLELEEIADLLIGLPPVHMRAPWEGEGNSLFRDLEDGRRDVVTFDLKLGIPTRWERLTPDGARELSAVLSEFLPTPVGLFPARISLEAHSQKKRLEIRYREPELNVELSPDLFVQEKPPYVKEIPMDSLRPQ
jgi:outer membrane lipoprotein-sorting protein